MVIAMDRQFQCPSCGAANKVTNPGVLMRVCDYCKTAIYWDRESALRVGKKSVDLPRSSRFKVGARGKIRGEYFTILGRLSYEHEKGIWNEWFVEMENGEIKWLTEDEGELFLESPVELTAPVPPFSELKPGMHIPINDRIGVVEELGEARCVGGEGQIPFQVEIGETYPYADGAAPDGSFSFGLEYDPTGTVTAFVGRILTPKTASVKPEDRGAPEAKTGEAIRCSACGKPYEGPRLDSTEMVVCEACGSGLQLDEATTRVVGRNVGEAPYFSFSVGLPVVIEGTRYEVMGRLYYVEPDEDGEYPSMEYVLYDPDAGYLWLSEDNGHFTISRPYHVRFSVPPIPVPKMSVAVGKETFKVYESGELTLRWVDGALPWTATVGEKTRYTHLIKPPEYVDQEITGSELELFRGRYVSHEEMKEAVPEGVRLPSPHGVHSCQPYRPASWLSGMWRVGIGFLLLNVILVVYSFIADKGNIVLKDQIAAGQYKGEHLTKPFTVPRDRCILRLRGSAPLSNSWLAMDFAVVNAKEEVISEFSGEASYYSGVDSEGSWTEGSRSFTSYFKVQKAGTYRLLVHAQGGTGVGGGPRNETMHITLATNTTISWYFFIPILLSGAVACLEPVMKWLFDQRRWAAVTGGGDDDD